MHSDMLTRRAHTAWRTAGLTPIGLHECRHTYAAFMIAAGVNAKALSTYMGHSSITITFDRYGHLMPGSEEEAGDARGVSRARGPDRPRALMNATVGVSGQATRLGWPRRGLWRRASEPASGSRPAPMRGQGRVPPLPADRVVEAKEGSRQARGRRTRARRSWAVTLGLSLPPRRPPPRESPRRRPRR